jgi:hypothetical protein
MSKPLTFHFSYGLGRTPRVLVIVDLLADCPGCGYTEIQRFFHGVPYHSLNVPRLASVVMQLPALLGYRCAQCGGDVAPEHCRSGALNYPFADGAGSLGAVFTCSEGAVVAPRYWVQGGRRLDPQALPSWEPPASAHLVTEALTEDDIFAHCGRVMQAKGAWRSLLLDSHNTGEALVEPVARHFWIAAGPTDDAVDAVVAEDEELAALMDRGALDMIELGPEPPQVPWYGDETPRGLWTEWTPDGLVDGMRAGALKGYAFLSAEACLDALSSTLRAGRLEFSVSDSGPETWLTDVATPRGELYEPELAMGEILRFAALTGITPGEAGRFVGEHVVASLLGLEL